MLHQTINLTNFEIEIKDHADFTSEQHDNISLNIDDIKSRMNKFSHGLVSETFLNKVNWEYVYISGGFVLSSIINERKEWSDIDFWIYGGNRKCCCERTCEFIIFVSDELKKIGYDKNIWSIRNNVITLYSVGFNIITSHI